MPGGYVNNCTFSLVSASLYEVLTDQKLKPHNVEMMHVELNKYNTSRSDKSVRSELKAILHKVCTLRRTLISLLLCPK